MGISFPACLLSSSSIDAAKYFQAFVQVERNFQVWVCLCAYTTANVEVE